MASINILIKHNSKGIVGNFISLSTVQLTNYLLPLLIFPYLVRTIGIEKYGIVSLSQSIFAYLIIVVDYGFNVSATRDIANIKNNKEISRILSKVITTKLFLSVFLILAIVIYSLYNSNYMYLYGSTMIVGSFLNINWFFQGTEKMTYITIANLITKIFYGVCIFVLIKTPNDYIYVISLLGLANSLGGLFGYYVVLIKYNYKIEFLGLEIIFHSLKDNFTYFLSGLSVSSAFNNNTLILGLFANDTVVGLYSISEKVIITIRQFLNAFAQAIYPHVCKLAQQNHELLKKFYVKIFPSVSLIVLLICLSVYFLSENIVSILTNKSIPQAELLIKIVSFNLLFTLINIPANHTILAYGFKRTYIIVMVTSSLFNVVSNLLLSKKYGEVGTAISLLLTELFMALMLNILLHFCHKKFSIFTKLKDA